MLAAQHSSLKILLRWHLDWQLPVAGQGVVVSAAGLAPAEPSCAAGGLDAAGPVPAGVLVSAGVLGSAGVASAACRVLMSADPVPAGVKAWTQSGRKPCICQAQRLPPSYILTVAPEAPKATWIPYFQLL